MSCLVSVLGRSLLTDETKDKAKGQEDKECKNADDKRRRRQDEGRDKEEYDEKKKDDDKKGRDKKKDYDKKRGRNILPSAISLNDTPRSSPGFSVPSTKKGGG